MEIFDSIYKYTKIGSYLQSALLLITRLYWGLGFVMGGLAKFQDIQKTKEFFASINIPQPLFNAFFVASTEIFCGVLLAIGLLARLATLPLIIILSVAYATAHTESLKAIFTQPSNFVGESPFAFLFACLIILAFGPGRISLDYIFGKER